MKVLLAPDKFKGSLSAVEVVAALSAGIRAVVPDAHLVAVPVADGGDGTLAAAIAAGFERVPVTASGPTGSAVATSYARRGGTAVVELADVCGLSRLPDGVPDPLGASSFGVGEVLAAALDAGVDELILGIGGSASTDGGAGMLQALGAKVLDAQGHSLARGGAALAQVVALDMSTLHPRLHEVRIIVASDVANPLCGPDGAAAVYGQQKGADAEQVRMLDAALRRWARTVAGTDVAGTDVAGIIGTDLATANGSGAAGGVGFAALMLGASLRPGIELVLELVGFAAALDGAVLVVTGEGSMDQQTLSGKAPAGVAAAVGPAGPPVVAVAGRCTLSADQLATAGLRAVYPLTDLESDVARCMSAASPLVERAARQLAHDWLEPTRAPTPRTWSLAALNAAVADGHLRAALGGCCAAPAWVAAILAGRPYVTEAQLGAASDAATAGLDDAGLAEALAAHPRIGDRPRGVDGQWSWQEQSAVAASGDDVLAGIASANAEYEQRFGHVYLVCATGRSAEELLAICRERLGNDRATERTVVLAELSKINKIRLGKLLGVVDAATVVDVFRQAPQLDRERVRADIDEHGDQDIDPRA